MIVEFYKKEIGNCPIEDFFDGLTAVQMRKTAWTLKIIKEYSAIPKQYFKKLSGTEDLWEVRVQAVSDKIRLLCFIEGDNLLILTGGFLKKSAKIPLKEIEIASNRKNDYKRKHK